MLLPARADIRSGTYPGVHTVTDARPECEDLNGRLAIRQIERVWLLWADDVLLCDIHDYLNSQV
jgi:hypothetical protein